MQICIILKVHHGDRDNYLRLRFQACSEGREHVTRAAAKQLSQLVKDVLLKSSACEQQTWCYCMRMTMQARCRSG